MEREIKRQWKERLNDKEREIKRHRKERLNDNGKRD